MKVFSAHLRPASAPVLVREGFSWGAAIFGALWLLLHRAWIAAAVALFASFAIEFAPPGWRASLAVALAALLGLFGQDLRRWSLARRGFQLAHVLAGRDQDEALFRLLSARPDLAGALR